MTTTNKRNKKMTKPKTNITCTKCGYSWLTSSKMRTTKCPSCGHSTFNPQYEGVQK